MGRYSETLKQVVRSIYDGGKISGEEFVAARWDLMQTDKYMWASVQTTRGCAKHC